MQEPQHSRVKGRQVRMIQGGEGGYLWFGGGLTVAGWRGSGAGVVGCEGVSAGLLFLIVACREDDLAR